MRSAGAAVPFLLFLVLFVVAVVGLSDVLPYRALLGAQPSEAGTGSGRRVLQGRVASGPEPLVVRARGRPDFLTGLVRVDPPEGGAATFDLTTSSGPVVVDWSSASVAGGTATARIGDRDYTGFALGDSVTVFGREQADGPLLARYISRMSPQELVRDRFAAAVRTLTAGSLLLGIALALPYLTRLFRSRLRSRSGLRALEDRGSNACPYCRPAAARGLAACPTCGRSVLRGRQQALIAERLAELVDRRSGGLAIRAGERVLRFRWDGSLTLEFHPGDLSPKDSLRARRLLAGMGFDSRREAGAVWKVRLGEATDKTAALANAMFLDVYGLEPDYVVDFVRAR